MPTPIVWLLADVATLLFLGWAGLELAQGHGNDMYDSSASAYKKKRKVAKCIQV